MGILVVNTAWAENKALADGDHQVKKVRNQAEIVQGSIEDDYKFPWVVNVNGTLSCKGTLIAPRWVLSAAHCLVTAFNGATISYSRKDPATGKITRGSKSTGINSVYTHPQYVSGAYKYDIALVRLPEPFAPDPLLIPAQLPFRYTSLGNEGVMASFSHTAGPLPEGKVAVLRGKVASNCIPTPGVNEFCIRSANASVCPGDSGSGFIVQANGLNYVTGIAVSTNSGDAVQCKNVNVSFNATDVIRYLDWIAEKAQPGPFFAGFNSKVQLYPELDFGLPSQWETLTGDFDGNGRTDYIRVGGTGAFVYWGKQDGSFDSGFQNYNGLDFGFRSGWKTITGDFNGDKRADYARLGATGAWVFLGAANGIFVTQFQNYDGLNFGLSSLWQVAVGDFNGDGKTDYARLGATGSWVYFGTPNAGFIAVFQNYEGLNFGFSSQWDVVTGDFNGDRYMDYARVGNTGAWLYFGNRQNSFDRTFQDYEGLEFGFNSPWKTIAGDFNGDGKSDYLRLGSTGAWLFYGNSQKTFTREFQDYIDLDFGLPSNWQTITGDFNGDGRSDYARLGDTGAFFFYGESNRAFRSNFQEYPRNFGLPSAWDIAVGDFNGDRKNDYLRLGSVLSHVFIRQ